MNKLILTILAASLSLALGCGGAQTQNGAANTAANKAPAPANEKKTEAPATTAATNTPSAVVKDIYESALKRNCSSILPSLTDGFKKTFGTDKDELEALCDSFTDSGKVTGAEVKSEVISGDTAKVKVTLTMTDGKKQEKEENMKKVGDKWLMDS